MPTTETETTATIRRPELSADAAAFLAKKHQMLIDGKWVDARSGKTFAVEDPATEEIIAALEKVAKNEPFVSRSMAEVGQRRNDRIKDLLVRKPQLEDLTAAERRILKLIAADRTTKEIADMLKVSYKTIENHRQNICNKLNLHGSHSLLKFAFDHKSHL